MAEWTKDPKETGAYWHRLDGAKPSVVWVANGLATDIFSRNAPWQPTCIDSFYGPLDQPPPMPSEVKPEQVIATPEDAVNPVAYMAAQAWAQSPATAKQTPEIFGKDVAQVYKACLAEIEGKVEAPKAAQVPEHSDNLAKSTDILINRLDKLYKDAAARVSGQPHGFL